MLIAEIPMRMGRGLNDRLHWRARARINSDEKQSIAWAMVDKTKPALPCVVTITRVAPSGGLDDDNLVGACKNARDSFATWIGVDDKRSDIVRYAYAHERGPWGVRIEVSVGVQTT